MTEVGIPIPSVYPQNQDMAEGRVHSLSGLKKTGVYAASWQAEKSTCRNIGSWEGQGVFGKHTEHHKGRLQGSRKRRLEL